MLQPVPKYNHSLSAALVYQILYKINIISPPVRKSHPVESFVREIKIPQKLFVASQTHNPVHWIISRPRKQKIEEVRRTKFEWTKVGSWLIKTEISDHPTPKLNFSCSPNFPHNITTANVIANFVTVKKLKNRQQLRGNRFFFHAIFHNFVKGVESEKLRKTENKIYDRILSLIIHDDS